jgi:hypothetical protein
MWQSCVFSRHLKKYTCGKSCASAIFAINHTRQSYDLPFQKVNMWQKLRICHFCNDLHVAQLRFSLFCNNLHVAKLCLCYLQIYIRGKAAPPQMYTPGKAVHPPFLQLFIRGKAAPPPFAKCIHAAKPRIRHFLH